MNSEFKRESVNIILCMSDVAIIEINNEND